MAETIGELLVKIGADVGDLESKMGAVLQSVQKLDRSGFTPAQKSVISFNQALELLAKGLGLLERAGTTAFGFLSEALTKAGAETQAITQLDATVRSIAGSSFPEFSKALVDLAQAFEATSLQSSEAILDAERLFISFGAQSDQIKGLTKAALDLSAGLGIDLHSAVIRIGQSLDGTGEGLAKYNITLEKTGTTSEKVANLQKQINQKFGGEAAAALGTTTGKLKLLGDQWDALEKSIGHAIEGSKFASDAIVALGTAFDVLSVRVRDANGEISSAGDAALRNLAVSAIDAAAAIIALKNSIEIFVSSLTAPFAKLAAAFFLTKDQLKEFDKLDYGAAKLAAAQAESAKFLGTLADLRARVEGFGSGAETAAAKARDLGGAIKDIGPEAQGAAFDAAAAGNKIGESMEAAYNRIIAARKKARADAAQGDGSGTGGGSGGGGGGGGGGNKGNEPPPSGPPGAGYEFHFGDNFTVSGPAPADFRDIADALDAAVTDALKSGDAARVQALERNTQRFIDQFGNYRRLIEQYGRGGLVAGLQLGQPNPAAEQLDALNKITQELQRLGGALGSKMDRVADSTDKTAETSRATASSSATMASAMTTGTWSRGAAAALASDMVQARGRAFTFTKPA